VRGEGVDDREIDAPVVAVGHGEFVFVTNEVAVNVPDVVIVTEIVFEVVAKGDAEIIADRDGLTETLTLTIPEKLIADEGEIEDETETDCDNLGDEVDETDKVDIEDKLTELVVSPETFGDTDTLGLAVTEIDLYIDRDADGEIVLSLDARLEEDEIRDAIGNIEGVMLVVSVRVVIPL
jgi:hypothetical protein